MLEFKLRYYFEVYKDKCIIGNHFKERFKKKHGDFPLVLELIMMIETYQRKKYGELIPSGKKIEYRETGFYKSSRYHRERQRFGTKEERLRRTRRDYEGNL